MSDKRLIIRCTIDGESAYFLLDSGASVGLIDMGQRRKYGIRIKKPFLGKVLCGGETVGYAAHCDTMAKFQHKLIPQFLLADISGVVDSIKRETGIEILGIVSLPQMGMIGLNIDINSSEVWLE